ncbi:MAG: hypothetical protein HOP28_00990, partial [Gemmatimonadales bacterium]|nr:hypothetical protein [Gemmatimonadales bacterium]
APARRHRLSLQIGTGAVAAFLVLRGFDLYGNPSPWRLAAQPPPSGSQAPPPQASPPVARAPGRAAPPRRAPPPAWLRFLNTAKYPASLLFLLMTLGPMFLLIPALEGARGWFADALAVFGRVPFFYYVLHIPLIHVAALLVSFVREGAVNPWLFGNHPMMPPPVPDGYRWSLTLLYAVWLVVVVILYFACRWFAKVKQTRTDPWLSYL